MGRREAEVRALVTGGGGFVGGAVVRALLRRGDEVTSFSRHAHDDLRELGVAQVQGDLADAEAVARAIAGHQGVFHVAGKVGAWGPYEAYERVNVQGAACVIDGCRRAAVEALVFTSSPSVVFDGTDFEGRDESAPYPDRFHAPYPRSKAHGERLVLCADDPAGLRTVALRPHLVLGPRDGSLTPRIVGRARAGKLRGLRGPPKKVDITWVDDAARAHLLAMDALLSAAPPCAGKPYFISSGEPLPSSEVFDRILAAAGLPPVSKRISPKVALLAATAMELTWRILGRGDEPPLTRWVVREMASAHWFDLSAAQRDLGYRPQVTHEAGFASLARWLASDEDR